MEMTARNLLRRHGLIIAFLLFLVTVAVNAEAFLTPGNILDVLRQVSITGMMALGVTFVVLTGRLDLSVGSLLTLLTVIVVDQHNAAGQFAALLQSDKHVGGIFMANPQVANPIVLVVADAHD